ncbi:hypothetical protein LTS18_003411, partial [Coniosporium uncinatum]
TSFFILPNLVTMFSSLFRLPPAIKRVCVWLADADADYYRNIRLSTSLAAATASSAHFAALYEAAEPFRAKDDAAAAEVLRLRRLTSAQATDLSLVSDRLARLRVIDAENAELLGICSRMDAGVQKCEKEHVSAGTVARLRHRNSQLEEENARLKATPPSAAAPATALVLAPAPALPTADPDLVASLRKEIQDLRIAKTRTETQSELHQDRAARLLSDKQGLQTVIRKIRSEAAQAVDNAIKAARAEAELHLQQVDAPLRAEVAGLRLQVQQKDGAIAQLTAQQQTAVQSATAQLQRELEAEKKAGVVQRMELRAAEKEKIEVSRENTKMDKELAAEMRKRREQLKELTTAETEVRKLRKEAAGWQQKWDERTCENCESLQSQVETLEEEKEALEDERDGLETANGDLEAEVDELKARL